MYFRTALFLSFLMLPFAVLAQMPKKFFAQASVRTAEIGSPFEITYTVEGEADGQFEAPDFKNFKRMGGVSRSQSTTIINGAISRSFRYTYVLLPKKEGTFSIAPGTFFYGNNQKVHSNRVQVKVEKGTGNIGVVPGEDQAGNYSDKDVFVRAIPSKESLYLGEQIHLDYVLYTSIYISNYSIESEADYHGFYFETLNYRGGLSNATINGKRYKTKVLKKVALFPQQLGKVAIDPLMLEIGIPAEGNSQQRGIFYQQPLKRYYLESEPIELEVKPLPVDQDSTNFAGAVGQFIASSFLNKNLISTDESVSLKMEVRGNGDVKRLHAPDLMLSDSFEVYDPKTIREEKTPDGKGLMAAKTFEYLIVPKYPGVYNIKPNFTFFDPDASEYVSIQPGNFHLVVKKGSGTGTRVNVAPSERDSSANLDQYAQISPLSTSASFSAIQAPFIGSWGHWLLMLLPILGIIGLYFYKRKQKALASIDPSILKSRNARKLAYKRLDKAKTHLDKHDSRAFYDEMSKALYGYAADKLKVPLSELNRQSVVEKLEAMEVSEGLTKQFSELLKTCELALFASMPDASKMQNTYHAAADLIKEIEA